MKRTEPDPLDANDPRVLVEWEDKLGQIIRPGDYVAVRGYSGLGFGKVLLISALRKDGRNFTSGGPQMTLHMCNLATMELHYWTHPATQVLLPLDCRETWPWGNVVRVDWKAKNDY
jgi:hypothetical protein